MAGVKAFFSLGQSYGDWCSVAEVVVRGRDWISGFLSSTLKI